MRVMLNVHALRKAQLSMFGPGGMAPTGVGGPMRVSQVRAHTRQTQHGATFVAPHQTHVRSPTNAERRAEQARAAAPMPKIDPTMDRLYSRPPYATSDAQREYDAQLHSPHPDDEPGGTARAVVGTYDPNGHRDFKMKDVKFGPRRREGRAAMHDMYRMRAEVERDGGSPLHHVAQVSPAPARAPTIASGVATHTWTPGGAGGALREHEIVRAPDGDGWAMVTGVNPPTRKQNGNASGPTHDHHQSYSWRRLDPGNEIEADEIRFAEKTERRRADAAAQTAADARLEQRTRDLQSDAGSLVRDGAMSDTEANAMVNRKTDEWSGDPPPRKRRAPREKLTDNDLIDWVNTWTPLGGGLEVAPMGFQRDRGAIGHQSGWVAKRGDDYAVIWVDDNGFLHGRKGTRRSDTPRDPMIDYYGIDKVAGWGSRKAAIRELKGEDDVHPHVDVFDDLKPGQTVRASMTAIMGTSSALSGKETEWKVGRRTTNRYGERITLLKPGTTGAGQNAVTLNKRKHNNGETVITAAHGDMGLILHDLRV